MSESRNDLTSKLSTLQAARRFYKLGLVVIPLRTDAQSKLPAWKGWQNKTPAEGIAEIEYRASRGTLGNIGIVAGRNSGNLFQFEIDGLELYAEVIAAIPELKDTWSVLSGGGNGVHIYGRADELPPTTVAKTGEHLEARFKSDGQQCVAPPSIHPDTGNPYKTYASKPIRHFKQSTLDAIMAFIEAKRPLIVAPAILNRPVQPRGVSATDEKGMVEEALRYIPADTLPYDGHGGSWISVLAALAEAFGDSEAERIGENWSGWCSKPNEIHDKIASFTASYRGQRAGLGTIFHLAKQNGYERPLPIVINAKPLFDYREDPVPANLPERGDAFCHPDGDPRNWLIAVCNAFPGHRNMPKFARLWWGAFRQGLIDPLDVTFKALFAARDALDIPITDNAIRDCVKEHTEGLFWNLNWKDKTSSDSQKTSGGRPTDHFRACTLAEVEQALPRWAEKRIEEARHKERGTTPNLNEQMLDVLDGDARRAALDVLPDLPPASDMSRTSAWLARKHTGELQRSLSDTTPTTIAYDSEDVRAALFAECVDPDTAMSYVDIKRKLALSKGAVGAMVKRAGFAPVVQVANCEINASDVDTFERQVYQARKEKGGFPLKLVETKADGAQVEHEYRAGDVQGNYGAFSAAKARGSRVELALRTANKYRPLDPIERDAPAVEKPAAPRPVVFREPSEIHPYYGTGYNPSVVRHWLKMHLRRLKWTERAGWFIHPVTGEKYDLREKSLLEFAESLGAVVMEMMPA